MKKPLKRGGLWTAGATRPLIHRDEKKEKKELLSKYIMKSEKFNIKRLFCDVSQSCTNEVFDLFFGSDV